MGGEAAAAPDTVRLATLTTTIATSAPSTARRTIGKVTRSEMARRSATQAALWVMASIASTSTRRRSDPTIQSQTAQAVIERMYASRPSGKEEPRKVAPARLQSGSCAGRWGGPVA